MTCGKKSSYGINVMKKLGCTSVQELRDELQRSSHRSTQKMIQRAIINLETHPEDKPFQSKKIKMMVVDELERNLQHFNGTEEYTRIRLPDMDTSLLLTDGAKYLAEKAQCYWLMDAILSHQNNPKLAKEYFQTWIMDVKEDGKAILSATDGNGHTLVQQSIPYTDFPLSHIELFAIEDDGVDGRVVLLTNEY